MNAPWQIYFHFVPESVLDNNEDMELTWDFSAIKKAVKSYFGDILWKTDGIFYNITQYGNLDESCIELSTKDGKTCNALFTLDLRSVTEDFIMRLCEFSSDLKGVILLSNGKFIKAEYNTVLKLMVHSKAAQFCMYIEPHLAKSRDEYGFGNKKWWEFYVPENLKKHTFKEVNDYIEKFLKDNKNAKI